MKSRPIIYQGAMVRAIFAGIKTQTRRIVKDVPDWIETFGYTAFTPKGSISGRGKYQGDYAEKFFKCPFGEVSDRLWVREAFAEVEIMNTKNLSSRFEFIYKADNPNYRANWRSPIYMPKDASRLTLVISNIKVRRLKDISEEEAIAEGARYWAENYCNTSISPSAKCNFRMLWDKLNGKKASWDSNPWVWVVEFRRLKEDAIA